MTTKLDKEIEREYYRQSVGLAINIMDIPRLFRECRTAIASGSTVASAVAGAVAKYAKETP